MAERRPFNIRKVVAEQLPAIQSNAAESNAALRIGRALEAVSAISGHFAERAVRDEATKAGARQQADEGGTPRLQSPLTLAGRSYNAAALDVFRGQIENRAREDVTRIARDNEFDPAKLEKELDANLRGHLSAIPESAPELRAQFQELFGRQKQAAMSRSFRLQTERLADQRRASTLDQIEGRIEGMERLATSASVNREARDQLIVEQRELEALLLEHGPRGEFKFDGETFEADETRSGIYQPTQIQALLQAAEDRVLEARVLGTFASTDDKRAFRDQFLEAFTDPDTGEFDDNPTTGLSRQQHETLLNKMDQELRAQAASRRTGIAAVRDDVAESLDIIQAGFRPPDGRMESLRARVEATGDAELMEDYAEAADLLQWTNAVSDLRPIELERLQNEIVANAREQGGQMTTQTLLRLQHIEKFLPQLRKGLENDPLTMANRVGQIQLDPVQFAAENPEDAIASMEHRVAQATEVSEYYGVPPKFLAGDEADALGNAFKEATVDGRLAIISNIVRGFGPHTRKVIGQIADEVPVTAHIAGIMALDETLPVDMHLPVARRALTGQLMVSEGADLVPSSTDRAIAIEGVVGGALGRLPRTRQALLATAEALYTERASRQGITPQNPDTDLLERSLHEAAGAVYQNGERVGGGFVEYNGSQTIIPPEVEDGSHLDEIMERLSPEDLVAASVGGEAPRYGNGKTVPPDDIFEHARLVPIDIGRYLVDMSDDGSQLLAGSGPQGHYVLDIRPLIPRQTARIRRQQAEQIETEGVDAVLTSVPQRGRR